MDSGVDSGVDSGIDSGMDSGVDVDSVSDVEIEGEVEVEELGVMSDVDGVVVVFWFEFKTTIIITTSTSVNQAFTNVHHLFV